MSRAAHTPGPWVAATWNCNPQFNNDGNRFWDIKPETFHFGPEYLETSGWMSEANARLIAAAPELLATLIALEKWFDIDTEVWAALPEAERADNDRQLAKIRAAIAKAKGGAL